MPEILVDVEVFCGTCGAGLCSMSRGGNTRRRGQPYIVVDNCQTCMQEARDDAYAEGYNDRCREEKT